MKPPLKNLDVAEVFDAVPDAARGRLLKLRELIYDVAKKTPEIGALEETLKWGEPSYLTSETNSGTTIRIHWKEKRPDHCALYVHCQTNLVEQFRAACGDSLEYEGKRAVLFPVKGRFPTRALRDCVRLALTYHLEKSF